MLELKHKSKLHMKHHAYARKLANDEANRGRKIQQPEKDSAEQGRAPAKWPNGSPTTLWFIAWTWLLVFTLSASAEDDHRIQFHAQGGSLDNISKDDKEIVKVSREPITKAEAISALDQLLDKLKRLKQDSRVVKADVEAAEELVPKMKDWVNRNGRQGLATGKSYSETRGNIRVDCETMKN